MTDMMIGMLFLFIIMLMFFALKFNQAAAQQRKTLKDLVGADDTRKELLKNIKRSMEKEGVSVTLDTENGILRLPESILFDSNKSELSDQGKDALNKLAMSLAKVLPRYTFLQGQDNSGMGPRSPHGIESIFVEGHTDNAGSADLNWRLSVDRAFHTYQALIGAQQILAELQNRNGQPVLSLAGYGKQRPAYPNDTPENKRLNRRIDLRFIMSPPRVTSKLEDIPEKGGAAP